MWSRRASPLEGFILWRSIELGQILLGMLFFAIGHAFGWFQLNLQNVSEWWKDKPFLSAILMGLPTSIFFWFAWKNIVEAAGSAWSARFIGSSTGMFVFSILTWYILGESMFTTKTMICLTLAILIILIQIFA